MSSAWRRNTYFTSKSCPVSQREGRGSGKEDALDRIRNNLETELRSTINKAQDFGHLFSDTSEYGIKETMAEIFTREKNRRLEMLTGNSESRRRLSSWLNSPCVDIVTGCVIMSNVLAIIHESNLGAKDALVPLWLELCSDVFLGYYVVELCLKLYAWRWMFFEEYPNVIDFFVVTVDVAVGLVLTLIGGNKGVPDFSVMRMIRLLRLVRLLRAFQVFHHLRELRLMLTGMASTFRAIFYGLVLVFAMLLLWSIVAVEVLHPLNRELAEQGTYDDERSGLAYESVARAFATFIQQALVADGWGKVSMPLMETYPTTAGPILILVFVSVHLALLNLVLTAIVDSAQQYRAREEAVADKERSMEFLKAKADLLDTCGELDTDESGTLDLQELLEGFDHNTRFKASLDILDVQRDDIMTLFRVLDTDGHGSISYDVFIDQLHNMKVGETKALLVFMKSELLTLQRNFRQMMDMLQNDLMTQQLAAIKSVLQKTQDGLSQVRTTLGAQMGATLSANAMERLASHERAIQRLTTMQASGSGTSGPPPFQELDSAILSPRFSDHGSRCTPGKHPDYATIFRRSPDAAPDWPVDLEM